MANVNQTIDEVISQEGAELAKQRVNILIAGNTGVGKSTLLNGVFGADVAGAASGAPQTTQLERYPVPGTLLTLWDTRGLESSDPAALTGLEAEIGKARNSDDIHDHIHVAWLCIASPSRRVEPVHAKLLQMFERLEIPTIVVFTQSYFSLPHDAKALAMPCEAQIEVLVSKQEGTTREPFGLEELVQTTDRLIPNGVRVAFSAAQKASWQTKKKAANACVKAAIASAAGTALAPGHTVALLGIQAAMFLRIDHIYGLNKADPTRTAIKSVVTGGARQFGTFLFRSLLTDAIKLSGFGYAAGAAAGAAIGGSITAAVGFAYVEGISRYAESDGAENIDAILKVVSAAMKQASSGKEAA